VSTDRTHRKKANLQDEINDMISDNHYDIGIRPPFDALPFFKVFHEDYSRENY
jgi:hypothetical protein